MYTFSEDIKVRLYAYLQFSLMQTH